MAQRRSKTTRSGLKHLGALLALIFLAGACTGGSGSSTATGPGDGAITQTSQPTTTLGPLVAPSAYADSVCGAIDSWLDAVGEAAATSGGIEALGGGPISDPAAALAELQEAVAGFDAAMIGFADDVASAGAPDVEGGNAIAADLNEALGAAANSIGALREDLDTIDVTALSATDLERLAAAFSGEEAFAQLDAIGSSSDDELDASFAQSPVCNELSF